MWGGGTPLNMLEQGILVACNVPLIHDKKKLLSGRLFTTDLGFMSDSA